MLVIYGPKSTFFTPRFHHPLLAIIHVIENLLLLLATTAFNVREKWP